MPSAHTPRGHKILRFVRRKPIPHKIVGETLAGEEVKVVVSGDSAAGLADTVEAVNDCTSLKAVDREGNLIRKLELGPNEELEDDEQEATSKQRPGTVISIDVCRLVDNIAKNFREVATASANQQASAFKEGFAAMTSVVNLCLTMLLRADTRLEEVEEKALVNAEGKESPKDALVRMAMQRAMGGHPGAVPPNGGNGAGMPVPPEMIRAIMSQLTTPSEGDEPHDG
jgi:hypothetical protein